MRTVFNFLKKPLLALLFTVVLESTLMLLTGDDQSCFFHNTLSGNILLWIGRLLAFVSFLVLFTFLFLPRYTSLKDRMLDREEMEASKTKAQEHYWKTQTNSALKQLG